MRQVQDVMRVNTSGQRLYEFTGEVERVVDQGDITTGLMTLFCRHTSCSLLIQENADPDVQVDLLEYFRRIVPEGESWMAHTLEGPDDMPAHIKSALTQTALNIPVVDGRLALGTWQGIYLFEHRVRPHTREIVAHLIGA